MSFKKINYNLGENIVKIKIEDSTGARQENWTIMMSDLGKFVDLMHRKYGNIKKDRDLDWTR